MTLRELKESAQSLPLSPGIYIMRDKDNRVIYVGKAKRLKNVIPITMKQSWHFQRFSEEA